jgi:hypothetical protein
MTNYEKVKEWRKNNPEKVLEQARRYRKKHPETNKKAKEKYRENNLEMIRENDKIRQDRKRKNDPAAQKVRNEHFKIRREAKMWEIAGRPRADKCDICNKNEMTVFDHCHIQGHFRGWICDRCNKTLGLVYDDIDLLKNLISYLEASNGQIDSQEKKCITEV